MLDKISFKSSFLVLFLLAGSLNAQQNTKKHIQKNFMEIQGIDPANEDFSDLEAIGNAIGESRVVMLGEQDHGDAPTFLAKTRLVKYLHEKKGFNVIAFESDFFGLNKGWDNLPKTQNEIRTFLKKNIYKLWSDCDACENLLYSYIPSTYNGNQPLMVTGFDNQMVLDYSKLHLKEFVDSLVKESSANLGYDPIWTNFVDSLHISTNIEKHKAFDSIISKIVQQSAIHPSQLGLNVLKNLENNVKYSQAYFSKSPHPGELRDRQMAANLKWLLEHKYPNEKIIVWAANAHIVKRPDLIRVGFSRGKSMGQFYTEDNVVPKAYHLGFASKQGLAGRLGKADKYKIVALKENSFETWLPDSLKYGFIDFRHFSKKSSEYFWMKGIGHDYGNSMWTKMYDGIFYIKDMYPCETIKANY